MRVSGSDAPTGVQKGSGWKKERYASKVAVQETTSSGLGEDGHVLHNATSFCVESDSSGEYYRSRCELNSGFVEVSLSLDHSPYCLNLTWPVSTSPTIPLDASLKGKAG